MTAAAAAGRAARRRTARHAWLVGLAAIGAWLSSRADAVTAQRPDSLPALYAHTGTVDLGLEGITGLTVDPAGDRLYLGNRRGMLWVDLAEPRLKGPAASLRITGDVEFAPGLDKVFFAVQDAIGMADLRRDPEPVPIGVVDQATDLVYEPTRRELYVFTRQARVAVFDARSGEAGPVIPLPGWFGHNAVAAGGRLLFNLGGQQGLYSMDLDSRAVSRLELSARLVSPFLMEIDPDGKYLFAAPARQIAAIEVATGRVLSRIQTTSTPGLAYDAGTGLLLASWVEPLPPLKLVAYQPGERGLTAVGEMKVPAAGRTRLEPTRGGFVQLGRNMLGAPTLLIWRRTDTPRAIRP